MNKVFLIGRLTKDPELRYTANSNAAVCTFTLAIDRIGGQNNGDNNSADFIPIVVWNKPAENCKNYLSKGSQCAVDGRIQTRTYDDQNGQRRYVTEVVASRVEFLGGKGSSNVSSAPSNEPTPYDFADNNTPVSDGAPSNTNKDENPFAEFGKTVEINDSDNDLPF